MTGGAGEVKNHPDRCSRCAGKDVDPQNVPKRWPCFGMCCLCNSSTQNPLLLGAELRDEACPVLFSSSCFGDTEKRFFGFQKIS